MQNNLNVISTRQRDNYSCNDLCFVAFKYNENAE